MLCSVIKCCAVHCKFVSRSVDRRGSRDFLEGHANERTGEKENKRKGEKKKFGSGEHEKKKEAKDNNKKLKQE